MTKINSTRDVLMAIADGATHMSEVNVQDGARIASTDIDVRLDYYPENGATITVGSSLDGWLNHTTDSTIISEWDGLDENRFFIPHKHDGARVILRGWPDSAVLDNPWLKSNAENGVPIVREPLPLEPPERISVSDVQVLGPPHYVWLGDALVSSGAPESTAELQSWHILDAMAPTDPHVWNAMKYLVRLGRKGGEGKRLEDLRKAAVYLERAIQKEYSRVSQ